MALGGFLSDSPIAAIWRYNGNEKETEEEGWGRGSLILAQGKTVLGTGRMALAKGLKMTSKWAILIVDDEFAVRESLRILLKPHYKIFAAPNGEEALKILRERKIDLITLDLNMPKLSGIDTLREIRKIDGKVPVIIVTGYGTQKDEKEALLYGVRDFISKPFNIKEIVSVIDGMLEERIEQESGAFKKKTRKV